MKAVLILCGALLASFRCRRSRRSTNAGNWPAAIIPEIRQYDLIRRTEAYDLANASRAYLPQVSFSAQVVWQSAVPEFPDALTGMLSARDVSIPGMHKDQYKAMLEVNQVLWDGGRAAAEKQMAKAESAERQQAAEVDLYALEGRVDDLYFRNFVAR